MKAAQNVYMTTRHMTQRLSWTAGTIHNGNILAAAVAAPSDLLVNVTHGRYFCDGSASPNGW